jgi:glycosyltransferase involved in cell wall biosynthesis
MIRGVDFIVFSDDWGRHPFSCMHIMKRFLPENKILWVNTIGMRSPRPTFYDLRRSVEKIFSWFGRPTSREEPPENLRVISPVMIPFNTIANPRIFNRRSVIGSVKKEIDRLGFEKPILLTTLPNAADYIGAFEEVVDIYYCVDDFTEWPGVNKNIITLMEEKLLNYCDIVFASAEQLCLKKERKEKRPVLIPHGVDFEHFNSGLRESGKSESMKALPKPIVGFFGAISPWLNFDLILDVATRRSDWLFVLIGPIDADISKLNKLKNVYFVGKVPYNDIPSYAAAFDVAIIPFLVNNLTKSVNPLKLLEYLACGLPVVSTDLPEIRKYSEVVYIADGSESFLSYIEKALSENSKELRQRRIEVARNRSWDSIAEKFSMCIETLLMEKK